MKRLTILKFAIAGLLMFASVVQAQDKKPATTPTPDVATQDSQASVSDNVVVQGEVAEVAPVAPVSDDAAAPSPIVGTSDCIGCGSASPMFQNMTVGTPMGCSGCNTGCGPRCGVVRTVASTIAQPCGGCNTCSRGCNSCGSAVQLASYVPASTSCCTGTTTPCCSGMISQVSYQQPLYQTTPALPVSSVMTQQPVVNPAPQPVVTATPTAVSNQAVTTSGCCGATTTAPVATTGTTYTANACCTPTRGRLLSRLFNRR